jgi:L-asparaginase
MSRIGIIATGGTIDKVYDPQTAKLVVGPPQVSRILERAKATISYRVESILRKDSLDLSDNDRLFIRQAVDRSSETQILITHGTDTMIETALSLREVSGRVIVITGAVVPAIIPDSDAEFNIGSGVVAVQCLQTGVYVAMNGRILRPELAHKDPGSLQFTESPQA